MGGDSKKKSWLHRKGSLLYLRNGWQRAEYRGRKGAKPSLRKGGRLDSKGGKKLLRREKRQFALGNEHYILEIPLKEGEGVARKIWFFSSKRDNPRY